jgi:hypothetical protein
MPNIDNQLLIMCRYSAYSLAAVILCKELSLSCSSGSAINKGAVWLAPEPLLSLLSVVDQRSTEFIICRSIERNLSRL